MLDTCWLLDTAQSHLCEGWFSAVNEAAPRGEFSRATLVFGVWHSGYFRYRKETLCKENRADVVGGEF